MANEFIIKNGLIVNGDITLSGRLYGDVDFIPSGGSSLTSDTLSAAILELEKTVGSIDLNASEIAFDANTLTQLEATNVEEAIIELDGRIDDVEAGILPHNSLTGVQGGTTNEYYHLTNSEHTEITTFFSNTDITGLEAEILTNGSFADGLHKHDSYLITFDAGTLTSLTSDNIEEAIIELETLISSEISTHTHIESDITDLDKYTQTQVDNLIDSVNASISSLTSNDISNASTVDTGDTVQSVSDVLDYLNDKIDSEVDTHNNLVGLQGGATDEYYHLTNQELVDVFQGQNADSYHYHDAQIITFDGGTLTSLVSSSVEGAIIELETLISSEISTHTHTESDITDLDKYTQSEVNALIGAIVLDSDNVTNVSAVDTGSTIQTVSDVFEYLDGRIDSLDSVSHVAVTVSDSSEIDFTITGQDITASIIAGSIDETKLDASINASLDLADSALQSVDASIVTFTAGTLTSLVATNVEEAILELESDLANLTTDHGDLVGLADDDHTQYLLLSGRGTQTIIDDIVISNSLTISGDLTVNGTTTTVDTESVLVSDNTLTLNNGEVGAGVTGGSSGIIVDRGTETNYGFVFDEVTDTFRVGLFDDDDGQSTILIDGTQPVATREDSPIDGGYATWNASESRFDTTAVSGSLIDGSGVATQLAYFSDGNTLTSSANLTYDGSILTVDGTVIIDDGSGTIPNLVLEASTGDITSQGDITLVNLYPDTVNYNTSYVNSGDEPIGSTFWDADNHCVTTVYEGSARLQNGLELYVLGDSGGGSLTQGQVVSVSGTSGNRVLLSLTDASDTESADNYIGIVTSDEFEDGHILATQIGAVKGIDTTGGTENWQEGDWVYVDPTTPGGLTNVKPEAPNRLIRVGTVTNVSVNQGEIELDRLVMPSLSDLYDVNGTPLTTNGQIMVWDNDNGYWDATENINDFKDSANIGFDAGTLTSLAATNVEDAIIELETFISSEISTHTHIESDITDLDKYTQNEVDALIGAIVLDSDNVTNVSAVDTGATIQTVSDVFEYLDGRIDSLDSVSHVAVTVSDSSEIDFTLAGQDITASIVAGSIDETKLDASVNASLDLADSALQSVDASIVSFTAGTLTSLVASNVEEAILELENDIAAAGDVYKVGTPVDNQVGVWTGDGTLEGDANFTWNGATLNVEGVIDGNIVRVDNQLFVSGSLQPHRITGHIQHHTGSGTYERTLYQAYPSSDTAWEGFTFEGLRDRVTGGDVQAGDTLITIEGQGYQDSAYRKSAAYFIEIEGVDTNIARGLHKWNISTDGSNLDTYVYMDYSKYEFNVSFKDFDFIINKNTSGVAYTYDAGLDTHTFDGTISLSATNIANLMDSNNADNLHYHDSSNITFDGETLTTLASTNVEEAIIELENLITTTAEEERPSTGSTFPTTPFDGQFHWDDEDEVLYFYRSTVAAWIDISSDSLFSVSTILYEQTIDDSETIPPTTGDPIYFDGTTWYRADSTTSAPNGVMSVVTNAVITNGRCAGLSGLTAGSKYYLAANGGLTTEINNTYIGIALSAIELLVDIDVQNNIITEYDSAPVSPPDNLLWIQAKDANTKTLNFFDGTDTYSVDLSK